MIQNYIKYIRLPECISLIIEMKVSNVVFCKVKTTFVQTD